MEETHRLRVKLEALETDKNDIEELLEEKEGLLVTSMEATNQLRHKLSVVTEEGKKMLSNLEATLVIKEERIVHLEACKLTQEQVEKIKLVKEERKKYQEEVILSSLWSCYNIIKPFYSAKF